MGISGSGAAGITIGEASEREALRRIFPRLPESAATIIGPGVTPDVLWQGSAPGAYNRATDQTANDDQRANFHDGACKVN